MILHVFKNSHILLYRLIIPSIRVAWWLSDLWLHPDMTEKLLTGLLIELRHEKKTNALVSDLVLPGCTATEDG